MVDVLVIVAIVLSGVGCLSNLFLWISMFHLFAKIKRMEQIIDDVTNVKIDESTFLSMPPIPRAGETITMLRRPQSVLLEQVVNSEGMPTQQTDSGEVTITGSDVVDKINEGFDNNGA